MKRKARPNEEARTAFHISTVSRRFNIHPQTLRLYEREGLLKPSRSEGNTRLYTNEDIRQLEIILNLVRDLGVNLAGVEVVLNMRRKMEQIEAGVQDLFQFIKVEFYSGREDEFEQKRQSIVQVTSAKIVKAEREP